LDRTLLADAILIAHFGFIAFVVGGFALILAGAALGWRWVHHPVFRYLHLAAIVFVAIEALVGMACPLTVWEDALRRASPEGPGFIGRWLGRIVYYDFPAWVFTTVYVLFALAVAGTLKWIPPRKRAAPSAAAGDGRTKNRLSSTRRP
jgi:polyferredoxin